MKRQFLLYIQQPKSKEVGIGVLSIDKNGNAHFFSGDGGATCKILADMIRIKIDFAEADGIMITGFEPYGFELNGKQKYRYQEWWLAYKDI